MEKLSFSFPKEEKLCGEIRVAELFKQGSAQIAYPLRACWRLLPAPEFEATSAPDSQVASSPVFIKVLMSAPKKRLHRANKRNRAKRLMREAYRLQKHALWQQVSTMKSENGVPMSMELAFVWLAEETLPYAKVYERMGRLLEKIQASLS